MPLAVGPRKPKGPAGSGAEGDQHAKVTQLLAKHSLSNNNPCDVTLQPYEEEVQPQIDQSDLWLVKYDELAQKSWNIPLAHLGCCKEGGELFSRLCMWVDINQQYVDLGLFPQWDDIARELNIDQMKTDWVRICVRPEQSFTRAILEMYMEDGGTLGEVIKALRKQKQYRIIQEISEYAEQFLDVYNTYHKASCISMDQNSGDSLAAGHVYSILKTLFDTFNKSGTVDPLNKFQLYSGGFKKYLLGGPGANRPGLKNPQNIGGLSMPPTESDLIVNAVHINQTATEGNASVRSEDSGYTSPHRYAGRLPSMAETNLDQSSPVSEITKIRKTNKVTMENDNDPKTKQVIRILLVFAKDGASAAEEIVNGLMDFSIEEYPRIKVDFYRLNELELWQSLIMNPEACLMKWLDEMDLVMPLLTPEYLQDLHDPNVPQGPPAPTSAMINKYIYTLLRSEYVARGCQNTKVRPAIPAQFVEQVYRCKPVQVEPMFKMWKVADIPTTKSRLAAIIKMWAKKHEL